MGLRALRRYLPYLRPYWGLVVIFGLSQLGSLAAAAAIPKVIQYIIDGPISHHQLGDIGPPVALLVVIGLLEFVFIYLRRNFSGMASLRMETDLRNDFYAHLQSLQVSFHDNWQSGQLLSRAISDIGTVRRFVSYGLIWFLQTIVTFAVVFVLMAQLDWQLAIVTVLCMLPIAYFSNRFHEKYKVIARRIQDQQGDLTTIIEEMATGVRIIKAFGRMPLMQARFDDMARRLGASNIEAIAERARLWTQLTLLPNLSLAAVLLLGGYSVSHGSLTVGGLIAFMNYVFMLTWPMDAIGWVLSMNEECKTAVQRLNEVMDSRPDIADLPGARAMERCKGRIELRGVGFKYPKSDEWILRDLNLTIEPGETLGLVGRTGSGKTTLAYLVPRLYDVTEGS
ncbi:MAG: ABC transporter ATP-binding protein, partial [Chloroflexi bacterium]